MKLGYLGQEKEILEPDSFSIVLLEIGRSDRTASARKVKDITAIKRQFILQYDAMNPEDIQVFLEYYMDGEAVSFIYEDSGESKNAMVYIELPFRELFVYDYRYSHNVTIILEER